MDAMEPQAFSKLIEAVDAGFCVVEQGRVVEANEAFRRSGVDADPAWLAPAANALAEGKPVRYARPGRGGWFELYAVPLDGPGGERVAALLTDVTERVRAVEALKEADRRKDEFLAMLAHELRNPLAPIRNAVSLMRLKGPPEPELQAARDIVDRQVDHLARLVDDLLDMSRITFGKIELRRERLDLRAVIEEAALGSRPLIEQKGHALRLRLGESPLWVDGDPVRLAQVIGNLLNNAARYTAPGGRIDVHAGAIEGEAHLRVADNGIGIAPDMLSRIFEPFMQIREPRRGMPAGIGVGLSLARMLVELHGGRIHAESAGRGLGSAFLVSLPLARAGARDEHAARPSSGEERRQRFLVVDDNVDAASTQAELLRVLGHEADCAFSGQEALRKAAQYRPNVVLLDLGMPGMDGFEVARHLRSMPEAREVRIIAQTGWGQESDRRRTAEAGFDAHLAKPVDVATLMHALGRGA